MASRRRSLTAMVAFVMLAVSTLPLAAQDDEPLPGIPSGEFELVTPDSRVQAFIRLDLPSVAEVTATTGAGPEQQAAHARAVERQQEAVRGRLEGLVIEELASLVVAVNGFRALVEVGDIAAISQVEGVASVGLVPTYRPQARPNLSAVGADGAHQHGLTGAGVTVAVIDTGVDYTHSAFQVPDPRHRPEFVDVGADHPFEYEIAWLAVQGVTRGCDPANTRFCPDETVTRGQMTAFLTRAFDLPPAGADHFVDDEGSPFEDDIDRLAAAGITVGCNPPELSTDEATTGRRFCPEHPVTRLEMASFLVGAFDLAASSRPTFEDVAPDDRAVVAALASAGIARGCDSTGRRFCPQRPVTRAELAAFLHRAWTASGSEAVSVPERYDGAAAYAANNPTVLESGTLPQGRVVGGVDLAGSHYDPSHPARRSPDPDPLDRSGHGTHVASTIAGTAGVAPGADLLAIKVLGDTGEATDLVTDAVEVALDPNGDRRLDDAVDVINLSLAPDVARHDDPAVLALQAATALDVVVVTTASGLSQPSGLITVGSSVHAGAESPALVVEAPAALAGSYPAMTSRLPPGSPPITSQLAAAVPRDGCSRLQPGSEGKVVLLTRGLCTFADKARHAATAGAVGAIVVDDGSGLAPTEAAALGETAVPVVLVDAELGAALAGTEDGVVTISPEASAPIPDLFDTLAGPMKAASRPDLSAPGWRVEAAAAGSGRLGMVMSGDSVAAAHVSGAAALVREAAPSLTAAAVEGVLTATTRPARSRDEAPVPLSAQGAGIVDAARAVTAAAHASPASVALEVEPDSTQSTVEVEVVRQRGGDAVYQADYVANNAVAGVEVVVPRSIATSAGRGSLVVTATVAPGAGDASEVADGWVILTNQNHPSEVISVPVQVSPRPVASVGLDGDRVHNQGRAPGSAERFRLAGTPGPGPLVGYRLAEGDRLQLAVAWPEPNAHPGSLEAAFAVDTDRDGSADFSIVAADHGRLRNGQPNGESATALFRLDGATGVFGYRARVQERAAILDIDLSGARGFLAEHAAFDFTALLVSPGGPWVGETVTVDPDGLEAAGGSHRLAAGQDAPVDSLPDATLWLFPDNPADSQYAVVAPTE